jgi:hypothetical protein
MVNKALAQNRPYLDPHLSIGQIRRIEGVGLDAKLVVISRVNPISDTCEVILLDHNLANATPRDYVANSENSDFKFGYSIMCDYIGNVSSELLRVSSVYGQACQFCVASIGQASIGLSPANYELAFEHTCFEAGSFTLKILGEEWMTRNLYFSEFFESCNYFEDYDEFIAREEALKLYYRNTSLTKLISSKPEEVSLTDIRNSLENNPYARMLVRG